jgi:cytochrome c
VANVDGDESMEFAPGRTRALAKGNNAYLVLNKIDLTNIGELEFAATANAGMGPGLGGTIEIHLNSPSGTLIGSTPAIAPPPAGSRRGGRGPRVKAAINKVDGVHDLYFVFVNREAQNTDILLSIADIKFNEKQ